MPYFEYDVTSPANTPATAPTDLDVALSPGRLVRIDLQFPRGCVGLVHATIRRATHQLYPTNPDGDIAGEGAIIIIEEDTILEDDPYEVTLRVWNEDDSFPHTVTYRFNILPMSSVLAEREAAELEQAGRRRALGLEPP